MKYLLPCPACGATTPVGTGQAGQVLQCSCGKLLDVPSIRGLQKLTPAVEEQSPVQTWSKRQGLVFLGIAVAVLALLADAGILLLRPAAVVSSDLWVPVDAAAIQSEVMAYSPAEGYRRYQTIQFPLPSSTTEQLKKGEVPAPLLSSAQLLIAFEGEGTQPLAPEEAKKVLQQLGKLELLAYNRTSTRYTLTVWFWFLAAVAACGLGLSGSTLLIPARKPRSAKSRTAPSEKMRNAGHRR